MDPFVLEGFDPTKTYSGTGADIMKIAEGIATKRFEDAQKAKAKSHIPQIFSIGKSKNSSMSSDSGDYVVGSGFVHFARVLSLSKQNHMAPADLAEKIFGETKAYAHELVAKSLSMSEFTSGGALLSPELARDFIDFISPASVVRSLGAEVWDMPDGRLPIPKETKGLTAEYVGENQEGEYDEQEFGQLVLSTKEIRLMTAIGNRLLRSSAGSRIEAQLMRAMRNGFASRENAAFIRGKGVKNTPMGLLYLTHEDNFFSADSTVNLTTILEAAEQAQTAVEECLEGELEAAGWLFSTRTKNFLYNFTNTQGNFIFREEMKTGKWQDAPFKVTNTIPNNLGGSSNNSEIYFGDFSRLVIGDALDVTIDASTEASYKKGGVTLNAFDRDETVFRGVAGHDFGMKYDKAFAVIEDVKWGASS